MRLTLGTTGVRPPWGTWSSRGAGNHSRRGPPGRPPAPRGAAEKTTWHSVCENLIFEHRSRTNKRGDGLRSRNAYRTDSPARIRSATGTDYRGNTPDNSTVECISFGPPFPPFPPPARRGPRAALPPERPRRAVPGPMVKRDHTCLASRSPGFDSLPVHECPERRGHRAGTRRRDWRPPPGPRSTRVRPGHATRTGRAARRPGPNGRGAALRSRRIRVRIPGAARRPGGARPPALWSGPGAAACQ